MALAQRAEYLEAVEAQYATLRALAITDFARLCKPLAIADCYFWKPERALECSRAAESLSDTWMPSGDVTAAWWYLGGSSTTMYPDLLNLGILLYGHLSSLNIVLFCAPQTASLALPLRGAIQWHRQETLGDVRKRLFAELVVGATGFLREFARFYAQASQWLQERLAISSGHIERHRRKQLMREAGTEQPPADVKIVELRRREANPCPLLMKASSIVEWSHRWLVTEHLRNQYYSSTGEHRRILVKTHIKGPADKPLIIPDHTIYAVTR